MRWVMGDGVMGDESRRRVARRPNKTRRADTKQMIFLYNFTFNDQHLLYQGLRLRLRLRLKLSGGGRYYLPASRSAV